MRSPHTLRITGLRLGFALVALAFAGRTAVARDPIPNTSAVTGNRTAAAGLGAIAAADTKERHVVKQDFVEKIGRDAKQTIGRNASTTIANSSLLSVGTNSQTIVGINASTSRSTLAATPRRPSAATPAST